MKQLLLLIMTVVLVGCGKKEDGKPQSNAKTPSPTTSTKSEPQTEPTDADTEEEKPLSEGTKLLIAQAEKGDTDAAEKLGDMYTIGMNVPEDHKEGLKWYRKAADGGNRMAQGTIASYYNGGLIVKQDPVTALAWANIAFENGIVLLKDIIIRGVAEGTTPMTAEQIAKAKELSKEMIKKNPKLIQE